MILFMTSFFIPEVLSILLIPFIFLYVRKARLLSLTLYESMSNDTLLDLTITSSLTKYSFQKTVINMPQKHRMVF